MPNQRAANKVRLGGFVERDLYRAVVAMAKREGFEHDKFGFTQTLIREALAERKKRARARSRRHSTRSGRAGA